jgi:hypothetical protein
MRTLILFVLLFAGCVAPPQPVVEVERAAPSFAASARFTTQQFFDMKSWITPKEERALRDFLADVPSVEHPKIVRDVEYPGPLGEVWGWKAPHNTNGYGIGDWVLRAAQRYNNADAFAWLHEHCMLNVHNYWLYFVAKGRGPNEGITYEYVDKLPGFVSDASAASGIPPEELVTKAKGKYLVPKVYAWDGSSYGRHHCYDFLAHALNEARCGFTDAEHERIVQMLEHYATHTITGKIPKVTHRHEYAHYYVRSMVAIYQTFKHLYKEDAAAGDEPAVTRWEVAQRCLQYAEAIVWYGFDPKGPGFPRATQARDGSWLWAWDQRQPDEPGWNQLNNVQTSYPWYVGLRASAWFYLWTEPDCSQYTRDLIAWVVVQEARWCVRQWSALPGARVDVAGTKVTHNGWVQGGMLPSENSTRWIYEDTQLLTPSAWSALPMDANYHPLTCVKHRETDDGYFARWWPDAPGNYERIHYPRIRISKDAWPDAFGPRLDINGGASWAGMPDVLFLAGLITGNEEWMHTGVWLCHDYLAFLNVNHSGDTLVRAKDDALEAWYGFHTSRGFYWGACACGEILRKMIIDGNYWARF